MADRKSLKALNDAVSDIDNDFQTILICAVRYSIGRATYMPGLVTGWIMGNMKGKLHPNTLAVMKRDIDETPIERRGMDCDQRTWATFREWLERQDAI